MKTNAILATSLHGDLPFKRKDKADYLVVIEDKPVVVQSNRSAVFPVVTHTPFESDVTDKVKSKQFKLGPLARLSKCKVLSKRELRLILAVFEPGEVC